MCWGDGFVTDNATIAANGLSDPNPFFTALLAKPYLNNVVISPHYYPPSVSAQTSRCACSCGPMHESCMQSPSCSAAHTSLRFHCMLSLMLQPTCASGCLLCNFMLLIH